MGRKSPSWGRLQEVIGSDSALGIGPPYVHRLDGLGESAFLDKPKAVLSKRIAGVQNSERKLPICNDHHHRKGEQEERNAQHKTEGAGRPVAIFRFRVTARSRRCTIEAEASVTRGGDILGHPLSKEAEGGSKGSVVFARFSVSAESFR